MSGNTSRCKHQHEQHENPDSDTSNENGTSSAAEYRNHFIMIRLWLVGAQSAKF